MHLAAGTIIIRSDATYPNGALVVVGPAADGGLRAYPQGGGPEIVLPHSALPRFSIVSQDEAVPIYRRARFEIEGCDTCFEGWSDGTALNGWARAWFDFQTAQTVLAALAPGWLYDGQADAFITPGDDGEESWPVAIVELPDGGAAKLYPIGAGSWIWDEAEDGGEQS
jgi:hypothetical protein